MKSTGSLSSPQRQTLLAVFRGKVERDRKRDKERFVVRSRETYTSDTETGKTKSRGWSHPSATTTEAKALSEVFPYKYPTVCSMGREVCMCVCWCMCVNLCVFAPACVRILSRPPGCVISAWPGHDPSSILTEDRPSLWPVGFQPDVYVCVCEKDHTSAHDFLLSHLHQNYDIEFHIHVMAPAAARDFILYYHQSFDKHANTAFQKRELYLTQKQQQSLWMWLLLFQGTVWSIGHT